jgi:hypothetical protein
MVTINTDSQLIFKSGLFTINVVPQEKSIKLNMQLFLPFVNTKYLPHTLSILRRTLPGVLRTECFNYMNQSFKKEVQQTEIGHLFEHILLEYLVIEKIKTGHGEIVFNGRTRWNWMKNPYGSFEIEVDVKKEDIAVFIKALKRSIKLTSLIINNDFKTLSPKKQKIEFIVHEGML